MRTATITLRDLERAFDENEARWYAERKKAHPDSDEIRAFRENCSALMEQIAAMPISILNDAMVKYRVALKRCHDGSSKARFAYCGDPDDVYVDAMYRQLFDYFDRQLSELDTASDRDIASPEDQTKASSDSRKAGGSLMTTAQGWPECGP